MMRTQITLTEHEANELLAILTDDIPIKYLAVVQAGQAEDVERPATEGLAA
jgi:hypothetical protein